MYSEMAEQPVEPSSCDILLEKLIKEKSKVLVVNDYKFALALTVLREFEESSQKRPFFDGIISTYDQHDEENQLMSNDYCIRSCKEIQENALEALQKTPSGNRSRLLSNMSKMDLLINKLEYRLKCQEPIKNIFDIGEDLFDSVQVVWLQDRILAEALLPKLDGKIQEGVLICVGPKTRSSALNSLNAIHYEFLGCDEEFTKQAGHFIGSGEHRFIYKKKWTPNIRVLTDLPKAKKQ
jgi:hypothetical protein